MRNQKSTKIYVTPSNCENDKNIKHYYGQSVKESMIRDLKPTFFVCRLFGTAPYTISRTTFSLSNIGVIYSGTIVILILYVICERMKFYCTRTMDRNQKVLTVARLLLLLLSLCVDIILCIFWDRKLHNSLNINWCYEKGINLEKKEENYYAIISWILIILNGIFFLFIGLLTYLSNQIDHLGAFIYAAFYLAMTFGILKFLSTAIIIRKSFRDLSWILTEDFSAGVGLDIKNANKSFNLHEVWSIHDQLSSAIEDLNSLYSIQLFFWFSTITFNITSRIYVFFETQITIRDFYKDLREILLLIDFIGLLISLTIVCHITAREANKISSIIFSPRYFLRRQTISKDENLIIGYYFLHKTFNFSAAFGFFVINLQLLLSIAGAITTYLVILIGPISSARKEKEFQNRTEES